MDTAEMSGAFDRALEAQRLSVAAVEYALRHGQPRSSAYRAAWTEFRQRVRTIDDLRRLRGGPVRAGSEVVAALNAAIERAMVIDSASMANAQLLDPRDRALRIAAHSGFGTEFLQFFEIVDHSGSACGRALANGHAVWVPDITRSPIFAGTAALEVMIDAGSRAVASVPITSPSGRLIGMISTHHARPTRWTNRRRLELQRVARATGRILDHLPPTAPGEPTGPDEVNGDWPGHSSSHRSRSFS